METLFYCLQMSEDQERSLQEAVKGIDEKVEQYMTQGCSFTYLDDDTNPYHQSTKTRELLLKWGLCDLHRDGWAAMIVLCTGKYFHLWKEYSV
jgi:hypothetical protein